MRIKWINFHHNLFKLSFVKNSIWGIVSNIVQNIFYSIFFVIIARKYSIIDFSNYILANTLYGFVLSFSSLGLGQWFIRELLTNDNKELLIYKFLKFQFLIGIFFYIFCIILVYSLYQSPILRYITLLLGLNIIFDNIIYVIKYLNIANSKQKKTSLILIIESFLKLLIGLTLFYYHFNLIQLSFILILLRFFTLNLFFKLGTSIRINIYTLYRTNIDFNTIKNIIFSNWPFIIIGSISVIYWRIGNIIISKFLTSTDVTYYEISYKLFTMAEIIPVIVSSTIFPIFIKKYNQNPDKAIELYKVMFYLYALYGVAVYTFVVTFSDILIPFLFGIKYISASIYSKEMFLTMLVFPTVLLQANLLIAMKMEKIDMWLNIFSLFVNLICSLFGILYFRSLSVINYSIFTSLLLFHIFQDVILYKKHIIKFNSIIISYISISLIVSFYFLLTLLTFKYVLFFLFWIFILIIFILFRSTFISKILLLYKSI